MSFCGVENRTLFRLLPAVKVFYAHPNSQQFRPNEFTTDTAPTHRTHILRCLEMCLRTFAKLDRLGLGGSNKMEKKYKALPRAERERVDVRCNKIGTHMLVLTQSTLAHSHTLRTHLHSHICHSYLTYTTCRFTHPHSCPAL